MIRKTLTILAVFAAFQAHAHAGQLADFSQVVTTSWWDGGVISPVQGRSMVDGRRPIFEASAGYLYLAREHDHNSPIVTSTSTGATLLGMSNLEGRFESGFEVRGRLSKLEFRYLQIASDQDSFRIPANVVSLVRFMSDDYFSTMVLDYTTDLKSAELNLLCGDPRQDVRFSGGFRYLQLDEDLTARFPGFTGRIFTKTRNDLYGLQLGADADLLTFWDRRVSLICNSKAGVYYADTNLDIAPNASGAVTLGSASSAADQAAFVGELGLLMRVQATRHLSFDAGYNLLYITGVALVGDQPQSADVQALQPATASIEHGEVLYHGLVTRATLSF